MLNQLVICLRKCVLEINHQQTKVLTMCPIERASDAPAFLYCSEGSIGLLKGNSVLKHLCRSFCGDLRRRGQAALDYRVSCVWARWRTLNIEEHRHEPSGKHEASPTALYCSEAASMTAKQLGDLEILQRKLLRSLLGWVHCTDGTWKEAAHKIKLRLEAGLAGPTSYGAVVHAIMES